MTLDSRERKTKTVHGWYLLIKDRNSRKKLLFPICSNKFSDYEHNSLFMKAYNMLIIAEIDFQKEGYLKQHSHL